MFFNTAAFILKAHAAILFIVLFINSATCAAVSSTATQEHNCGRLEERILNNFDYITLPKEYPWIARLLRKEDNTNNMLNGRCLATLITKVHLIAPAHCFRDSSSKPTPESNAYALQLGVWKETNDTHEWICNRSGYCVPPPLERQLANITLHPNYDKFTHDNNIAIIELAAPIPTDSLYIQPICLNAHDANKETVSAYFEMAGFTQVSDLKVKTGVTGISRRYCDKVYAETIPPNTGTQFCTHQDSAELFYAGSTLMGLNIERNVPKSFFLMGFLVEAALTEKQQPPVVSVFQDVQLYKKWILSEIRKQ